MENKEIYQRLVHFYKSKFVITDLYLKRQLRGAVDADFENDYLKEIENYDSKIKELESLIEFDDFLKHCKKCNDSELHKYIKTENDLIVVNQCKVCGTLTTKELK